MAVWDKVRGTIETLFQIGLGGPNLKANAGAVEARNAADSAYAVLRGASPIGDNDMATRQYVDTLFSRIVVTAQFDGNNALPSNSATEKFYVVSSTGPNATIGQILWDDGLSSGTTTVLAAKAQMIVTSQAFSGGTITFKADTPYVWDTSSVAWVNAGGSVLSGSERIVRFAITNAASQSSATLIPANATITQATLDVATPYSGGATITVGQTGTPALLMATTDSNSQAAGVYEVSQDTAWGGSALAVLITVAGTPAAGAGFCIVKYTVADA